MNIGSPVSPLRQRRAKYRVSRAKYVLLVLLSLACAAFLFQLRRNQFKPVSAPVRDILRHIEGYPPQDLSSALVAALAAGSGEGSYSAAGLSGY